MYNPSGQRDGVSMASTLPAKSQPLHNFDLQHLTWNSSEEEEPPHHHRKGRRSLKSPSKRHSPPPSPVCRSPLRDGSSSALFRDRSSLHKKEDSLARVKGGGGGHSRNQATSTKKDRPKGEIYRGSEAAGFQRSRNSQIDGAKDGNHRRLSKSSATEVEKSRGMNGKSRNLTVDGAEDRIYRQLAKSSAIEEEKYRRMIQKSKNLTIDDAKDKIHRQYSKSSAMEEEEKRRGMIEESKNLTIDGAKDKIHRQYSKSSAMEEEKRRGMIEESKNLTIDGVKGRFCRQPGNGLAIESKSKGTSDERSRNLVRDSEKSGGVSWSDVKSKATVQADVAMVKKPTSSVIDGARDGKPKVELEADVAGTKKSKILIRLPGKKADEDDQTQVEAKHNIKKDDGVRNSDSNIADEETKTWNLRPRKPIHKSLNAHTTKDSGSNNHSNVRAAQSALGIPSLENEGNSVGGGEKKGKRKLTIDIPLTKGEIEEDIFAMTGSKPARRPKKRAKNLQKQLDCVFPGLWLVGINADSYKVSESSMKFTQG